jgi:hypothetical protein
MDQGVIAAVIPNVKRHPPASVKPKIANPNKSKVLNRNAIILTS